MDDSHPSSLSRPEVDRLRFQLEKALTATCPQVLQQQREDLVQEAMVKVMRLASDSPDRELNATYLWRTAYCTLIDELRRRQRRGEVSLEEASAGEAIASPVPGPEARHRGAEIRRALRCCLEILVRPRRLAVILHLQGETAAETAQLLGWKRKQVYNLTTRGLADLRRCLTSKGVTM